MTPFLFRLVGKRKNSVRVKFAGGMGTQILQAATFFKLIDSGQEVSADLGYFDRPLQMATVGDRGVATHWHWQLDHYGLTRDIIRDQGCNSSGQLGSRVIADGAEMMEMGISGLMQSGIRQRFPCSALRPSILDKIGEARFLCVHIRRGDFVNVASHLLADDYFLEVSEKFRGLLSHAAVLSDSPLNDSFREQFKAIFPNPLFLDHHDPVESHTIMRKSAVLVCSNSTFSLTAGLLNDNGLVFFPRKWFGDKDANIEKPIHDRCKLELLS